MKSELLLAINQICAERDLPRDLVLEAVRTAIAEAYRKDVNAPKTQNITAQIDLETGRARILVERRVVATVTDPVTEITLEEARKLNPRIQLGETIMVDSTPKDFGRIAAQAARQRIIQCIREAEREVRYTHFAQQAGEIVQGVVQSVTPQQVTLHIDRTEAILPQKEMIPGERYNLHDRIRVYILEVRRTPRGPEIIVSRSHKKLLQRLLELEVPEIANGVVEIKALVREAGSRSKVAVASRQPGVDPVGACVGMRSVRIQSILRELGNEKVDIIEWSPDPVTFIARALGPAKVLSVVLDEEAEGGRMAHVVVPDDQLSLAIGKAGQNARLAAKLTGWRIDIQNATEAAQWALRRVNEDPDVLPALGPTADLLPQVEAALKRHAQEGGPYTAEELVAMRQVIEKVRQYYINRRQEKRRQKVVKVRPAAREREEATRRAAVQEALARIPSQAYQVPVERLGLSERTLSHLRRHGMTNVGQLMERLAEGEEGLLKLDGIGAKVLSEIRSALEKLELPSAPPEVPEVVPEEVPEAPPQAPAPEVPLAEGEIPLPETVPTEEPAPIMVEAIPVPAEPLREGEPSLPAGVEMPVPVPEEPEFPATAEESPLERAEVSPMPSAVIPEFEAEPEEWEEEEEEEFVVEKKLKHQPKKRKKKPLREYIYDEELGRTIAIRRRRRGDEWDEF
ncbi:MAG: transcription termination factor NusA [Anaerolineae bacterium]|nr:transcription termination factor NusA [Anaerolineae bacterium]MCX8067424.1 transcription termination factor NusA [Anaerolineae bacterium]